MESPLEISQPIEMYLSKVESHDLLIDSEWNEILATTRPPIDGMGLMPSTRSARRNTIICSVLCIIILMIVFAITLYAIMN
jgi:hypothetical protein